MATVVLDGPFQFPVRRLCRFVASLVGGLIFAFGLVSVVPFVLLSFVGFGVLFGSDDNNGDDELPSALTDHLLSYWLVAAVLVLVGMPLGTRLVRGRREFVLFLRRFGYSDATRTVSAAIARIGASWRIVTLDDAEIDPMGVEPSVLNFFTRTRRVMGFTKKAWVVGARVLKLAMVAGAIAAAAIVAITYRPPRRHPRTVRLGPL